MHGNFECIGLRFDSPEALGEILEQLLPNSSVVGTGPKGAEVLRWEDASGARVAMEFRKRELRYATPSFAGTPSTRLRDVWTMNEDTSNAHVVDESGEVVTQLAVELEEHGLVRNRKIEGLASLVAFVGDASVHQDADAFAASDESLLDGAESAGPPPAHFLEQGWPWPPRMGPQSFISMGVFGPAHGARPLARLNGVVQEADERTNTLTGLRFVRARVATAGFEVDVCAPSSVFSELPARDQVLSATVFMVGSLSEWAVTGDEPRGWRARLFGRPA